MAYIDFDDILSYSQADIYYINGARGTGKTFRARRKALERYDKAQAIEPGAGRFCAITRYSKNKDTIERGYFQKLQQEGYATEYEFYWKSHACYRKHKETQEVEQIGYCVALTDQGITKEETYAQMKHGTIIFDEVALDRRDTYHRYLKDEYNFYFLSVLNSVLREKNGEPSQVKIFMLSNAVDMTCPYYDAFGLTYEMLDKHGIYWALDKSVLFVNAANEASEDTIKNTIVGRLAAKSEARKMMFENKYEGTTLDFIEQKPITASYIAAIYFAGDTFALWYGGDYTYINNKAPNGQGTTYTLTLEDNTINYQAVKKADPVINSVVQLHYSGRLRFSNALVQAKFNSFLRFVGVV